MGFCNKCDNYTLAEKCACKCFDIIDEDGEEHQIFALSAYNAAIKYAKKSNEDGDNYLLNSSVVITVNGKMFTISAEEDINYSSQENR